MNTTSIDESINGIATFHLQLTTWDSASSPSRNSLAIVGDAKEGQFWFVKDIVNPQPEKWLHIKVEQMVVEFRDENIIMSGQRNGRINLSDHRSRSTVTRLKHSSGVTGLSDTKNPHHVLVSGWPTTSLYDLRYVKLAQHDRIKRKGRFPDKLKTSQTVLEFHVPEERRPQFYGVGKALAYIRDLDIAVITSARRSQEERWSEEHMVTVYDASTGRILPSPLSAQRFEHIDEVRTGRLSDGPESILIRDNRKIWQWSIFSDPDEFEQRSVSTSSKQYMFGKDRFPPNNSLGMPEKWKKGNEGPV